MLIQKDKYLCFKISDLYTVLCNQSNEFSHDVIISIICILDLIL